LPDFQPRQKKAADELPKNENSMKERQEKKDGQSILG